MEHGTWNMDMDMGILHYYPYSRHISSFSTFIIEHTSLPPFLTYDITKKKKKKKRR